MSNGMTLGSTMTTYWGEGMTCAVRVCSENLGDEQLTQLRGDLDFLVTRGAGMVSIGFKGVNTMSPQAAAEFIRFYRRVRDERHGCISAYDVPKKIRPLLETGDDSRFAIFESEEAALVALKKAA